MNISRQSITREGIEIVDPQGRTFAMTREEIRALFQSQTGTRNQKRSKTLAALRDLADVALPDCGFKSPDVKWTVDFDDAGDGGFVTLQWELVQ